MTLSRLRKRVDRIDRELLRLLNRRAEAVVRIGAFKKKRQMPVLDNRREEQVLNRMTRMNRGPLPPASVRMVFREILRYSRRLQGS